MGCDIHLSVERKNSDGVWEYVPFYQKDREGAMSHGPGALLMKALANQEERSLYENRSYDVFAILANVRNGYGFAGVETGGGFVPISEPKGLPDDVSAQVASRTEGWGSDGHSHSYLTLRELLEFDWDQTTTHCGFVQADGYTEFLNSGKPSSSWADIWGNGIEKVTNEEMQERICQGTTNKDVITKIRWAVTYREAASDFLELVIPELQKLSSSPDEVRIVFWFDN